jgi:hypothetical protein
MKLSIVVLLLGLGAPLPWVESSSSFEDDAIVEVSRSTRRCSSLERQKTRVLPAPVQVAPATPDIPVLLRPTPHYDIALDGTRPPPAR